MTLTWKERLHGKLPDDLAQEIDDYETQIALKRQGKLDDRVFAETRLRRGVYGQRYDNGQRHDGTGVQDLRYPCGDLKKGPDTIWDAPGMQRIKIPFGGLDARQMEILADLSEEYSNGVCHVTTRQDMQLHYVHIEDTPSLMRRLAAVGITTREACGNTVRNVTACPLAGVCRDQAFDVTPYADACMRFLIGHPDTQDFGRKFKVAFSGCREEACGLAQMHDLGAVAVTRMSVGVEERGFELYVGGGLGAVPHQAQLFDRFLPDSELLPVAQAIARVYRRLGEKKNRGRARLKFLVAKIGIDEFRRLVVEERATLRPDPRWTAHLAVVDSGEAEVDMEGVSVEAPDGACQLPGEWLAPNVYRQRQAGYCAVTVALPLGDITAQQLRGLADVARRYTRGRGRTTVEQNVLLRWVRESDLPQLHGALQDLGLAEPSAHSIVDVTACPGTDTCKLGIASSRGLAAELRRQLAAQAVALDEAVRGLRIKISGCFNSCGQHHVADIGFYGVSRNAGIFVVPHFQVVLGGRWRGNAAAFGLAIGAVPSKRIPEALWRLLDRFLADREAGEAFHEFTSRVGKRELRAMLEDLASVPAHDDEPDCYTDWGDPREFSLGDMGVGECAGEVVSLLDFHLAGAEGHVFDAQLRLESGDYAQADALAYAAMLQAAQGLVKTQFVDVSDHPDEIVREFRERFFDTQLFFDRFAGGKFAQYLFGRHATANPPITLDAVRRVVEEAQLFLEAAHACQMRIGAVATPEVVPNGSGAAAGRTAGVVG